MTQRRKLVTDEPQAPAEAQDKPGTAAPEGTTAEQDQNWQAEYEKAQQNYDHLRPQFDKATSEREAARQEAQAWQVLASSDDADARQEAADFLGVELVSEEDNSQGEYLDPTEELSKKYQALEQRLNQQEQQAQEQAQMEQEGIRIGEAVNKLQTEHGVDLDEKELKAVYGLSVLLGAEVGTDNNADTQAAWDLFNAIGQKGAERVLSGKKAARVSGGQDASKKPDMSNRKDRLAYMEEKLAAMHDD
jgi:hypothetical protein